MNQFVLPLNPQLSQEIIGLVHYLKQDGAAEVQDLAFDQDSQIKWNTNPPEQLVQALKSREEGRHKLEKLLREREKAEHEEEEKKAAHSSDDNLCPQKPKKKSLGKKGQVLKATVDRQKADKVHRNSVTSTSKKQLLVNSQQRRMSTKKKSWLPEEDSEQVIGKMQK